MVDDWWPLLSACERKVLWLASWTIHHANHLRDNVDGLKVGGHQASSASVAAIMTALYFHTLRPTDRVAVKPHAAPIYHAIQYLLGRQTREKLEGFRGYKGAQSYPSRTKDSDDVDFSTGSVGLGVAQTLFSSLVQDYVRAHGWGLDRPEGRMIAPRRRRARTEGNIFEKPCSRAGSRAFAIAGGSSTTTGKASTRWCAKGCGSATKICSAISAGTWWCSNMVRCSRPPSPSRAARCCGAGSIGGPKSSFYSALVSPGRRCSWRKRLTDEIGDQGPVSPADRFPQQRRRTCAA